MKDRDIKKLQYELILTPIFIGVMAVNFYNGNSFTYFLFILLIIATVFALSMESLVIAAMLIVPKENFSKKSIEAIEVYRFSIIGLISDLMIFASAYLMGYYKFCIVYFLCMTTNIVIMKIRNTKKFL